MRKKIIQNVRLIQFTGCIGSLKVGTSYAGTDSNEVSHAQAG
jgi:hypothetical protein